MQRANDGEWWIEKILDGATLTHELRIVTHDEFSAGLFTTSLLQGGNDDRIYSSWQHCAAHDNRVRRGFISQRLTNLAAHLSQAGQIQFAIAQTGCRDANERELRFPDCGINIASSVEPAGFVGISNQFVHSCLDDRAASDI